MTGYADFLASKSPVAPEVGLGVAPENLNPTLFPFQRDIVSWALTKGRAAVFADTGLGKTGMQLEWARCVAEETEKPVLILAPLAVASQTVREGRKFGVPAKIVRDASDVAEGVSVANYERLHLLDVSVFGGVVLDESSILKGFGSKTRWALNRAFGETPYRLCCTATPAPNQHTELGTHAHFLGVMDHGEMLTRWFSNDTTEARVLTLKPHGERDFWRWVASWAVCVSKPSDLRDPDGKPYPDEGYDLPPLLLHEHVVEVEHAQENGELFAAGQLSATEMHGEMRRTAADRAKKVAELVGTGPTGDRWVIWCNTNYEADELKVLFPHAVEVRGSETLEAKETKLNAFSEDRIRILASKPSIAGFGLNWQHCSHMAFVGLSYSYEQMYQALRRSYRFGQTRPVEAHLVCAETETGVMETIRRKQADHREMQRKMAEAMREYGLGATRNLRAEIGSGAIATECGRSWTVRHGDSVELIPEVPDDSVHLSVFSPPFSSLYSYSPSLRDMGNCATDEEFFEHFSYLIRELLRITVPGRLAAVHTKDLQRYRNVYGYGGLRDFTGEVTRAFEDCALEDGTRWGYHSKVTIWKDPVREMQRTKSYGLLYKTLRRDASYSRVGCPEYLVLFRKWTADQESREPVRHERGTPEEIPLETWQRYASPVWDDIRQTNVLNAKMARDGGDEKHLAPLQLDLIDRCIELWSNPGDLVFDPFSGLGSTGYQALQRGRRYLGFELKDTYFRQSVRHLRNVEDAARQDSLLDALEVGS